MESRKERIKNDTSKARRERYGAALEKVSKDKIFWKRLARNIEHAADTQHKRSTP